MNTTKVISIIDSILTLNTDEFSFLFNVISVLDSKNLVKKTNKKIVINCSKCNSDQIYKHGKRNGKQRYKCCNCQVTFTYSWIKGFHQSHYDKLIKFIKCLLLQTSLEITAQICQISKTCAFNWRHKILNLIEKSTKKVEKLSFLVEFDNFYFEESKKGNHKKGIGRKARKRGQDPENRKQRGVSKLQVCISTAVSRNKEIVVEATGLGATSSEKLIAKFTDKFTDLDKTTLISDGEKAIATFANKLGLNLKVVFNQKALNNPSKFKTTFIVENNIKYHIENVNSFQSECKRSINSKFKGVASKYLLKYLCFQKWMRLNKNNIYTMRKKLIDEIKTNQNEIINISQIKTNNLLIFS